MQIGARISLNAIRVFTTVARTGSLTTAGAELGVTPGAVSHQLKKLEDGLRVTLFRRGNNSVTLTDIGEGFYQKVAPAIGLIEHSAEALSRDENEITVQASMSLAVRWLIPALDRFRAICPKARVRVETSSTPEGFAAVSVADVSIQYFRDIEPVTEGWELLGRDLGRPVASLALLAKNLERREPLPALICAAGNWDWKLWCEKTGVSLAEMFFAHEFDTDDAALHACVAGLGMVLAPPILIAKEMRSGALVPVPGYGPAEIGSYRYQRRSESRVVRQFCTWIHAEAGNID